VRGGRRGLLEEEAAGAADGLAAVGKVALVDGFIVERRP
jgi:hypothetical protein